MKKALVWFRNDLRVRDNKVLSHAVQHFDEVYAVYCFDDREFEITELALPRTGPYRAKFLLESVKNLRENLQSIGGQLIIRKGNPVSQITSLAKELGIQSVITSREITSEEKSLEDNLERKLWAHHIDLRLIWQSTLYDLANLPWPTKHVPEVFTEFRKDVEKEATIASPIGLPGNLNSKVEIEPGQLPTLESFQLTYQGDERASTKFIGGEDPAWERLNYYLWETDLIASYKETRNGLIGADYSSKLSPWLALGCISPRAIWEQVKQYEVTRKKNSSTYWLIFELLWRDYFKLIAKKHGTAIFQITGIKRRKIDFKNDKNSFAKWKFGNTGVPFVDANMKELNATGFMSNRGRQNVASYLVHDLGVNWTWGASYFESKLIDYDVCSNWANWNYIAGVGNDPRKDRYFNISSQAERYDPDGSYVSLWLPEKVLQ